MNEQTEETCHCGANMEGCDHCWHCQCEQWETTCNERCTEEEQRNREEMTRGW